MAEKLGIEGVIAYSGSDNYSSPSWQVIERCRDLRLAASKSEADHSSRASRVKRSRGAMIELGVEFDMIWDKDADDCINLHTYFWNHTQKEFFIADGDVGVEGTKGVRMHCEVHGFDRDEPLDDGMKVTISIKPCPNAAHPPAPFTVPES